MYFINYYKYIDTHLLVDIGVLFVVKYIWAFSDKNSDGKENRILWYKDESQKQWAEKKPIEPFL